MKRYVYIILGVVVIVAIVAIFLFTWRSWSSTTATPTGTVGSLPGAGTQPKNPVGGSQGPSQGGQVGAGMGQATGKSFGVLSNETVLNYFVNASNTTITVQPDGKIEEISGGQSSYLSSPTISNIISADFSYDGKRILVGFGERLNPQWSVFDVDKKAWTPLTVNPTVAAWSPSDYQIAYFATVNGARALETIDFANLRAKPKLLISLPSEDFGILWPSPNMIFLSDKSNALFSGSIFALNPKTGSLSTIVQNRVGLEVRWNASGTMGVILAGTRLGRGGSLGIIDNAGNLVHEMSFLTLPSKCVFPPAAATATQAKPSASVICGVPRDASALSNNQLPDAYDEMRIMTSDDIYQISLADGKINPIFNDPSQGLDIWNVKFLNGAVFFINRYDQKLYAMSLAQ